MVPLDKALVSFHRLSTEAVWPQFAMRVYGGAVGIPIWGAWGIAGGPNWYRAVAVCFFTQFFDMAYRLATIHTLQTDDRQTDGRTDDTSYHKCDR